MKLKLTLLLFSLIALGSCAESNTESKVSERKVKWESARGYCCGDSNSVFSGKVESAAEVNLSFRVPGVIDQVAGKGGTFVKRGETIASLDRRDYIEQLNATQAEWDAVSGEANRVIALYESKSVSENDYNKAVSALEQITAKLNTHRNALNDTRLVAPFDGYIQRLNFDCEETVGAGMPIVSFVSTEELEVVVNIPYSNYIQQDNFVSAVASSTQLPGREFTLDLIGVTPKANLNQLHTVRFAISPMSDNKIVAGMSVVVTMNYKGDNSNSVVLPLSAVVERDSKSQVWILRSDNTIEQRRVVISEIKTNGEIIISSGVNEGEKVVTAGVNRLKEGMKVIPMTPKSKTNIGGVL